jgi:hypothetical protein
MYLRSGLYITDCHPFYVLAIHRFNSLYLDMSGMSLLIEF